jgi:hypothetical protein
MLKKFTGVNMKKVSFVILSIFLFALILLVQSCNKSNKTNLPKFRTEELIPSYIKIDSVKKIYFTNRRNYDFIVYGTDKTREFQDSNNFMSIFAYDSSNNLWEQKYSNIFDSPPQIDTGYINHQKFLLISDYEGTDGAYTSYVVLGYDKNRVKLYLIRKSIFQGSAYFLGNQIIETNGNESIAFSFNGEAFVGTPLISNPYKPLDVNDVIIEYSVDDLGNIRLNTDDVKIRKDQKLYIIRNGQGASVRVLYPGNILKLIGTYYLAKNIGSGKFTISPGYDWDKSKDITIEVYK